MIQENKSPNKCFDAVQIARLERAIASYPDSRGMDLSNLLRIKATDCDKTVGRIIQLQNVLWQKIQARGGFVGLRSDLNSKKKFV